MSVEIDTGDNEVIAVELYINFDSLKLRVQDITPGTFFSNPDTTNKTIDNQQGSLSLTILIPPNGGVPQRGNGTLAEIAFSAIDDGSANISFAQKTLVGAVNSGAKNMLVSSSGATVEILRKIVPGDINEDGTVNLLDYVVLFEQFGKNPPTDLRADINKDGDVNILDYVILFENFGK